MTPEFSVIAATAPTPRARTGYLLEQREYAARYKTSDRTIKRWVKTGKLGGELPPLDAPQAMPAWWARFYKQRVPPCILEAAQASTAEPGASVVAAAPAEHESIPAAPSSGASEAASEQPVTIDVGTGFREMLERVRRAEGAAYQEYDRALKGNDESKLPLARKTWAELSKQLRELERDSHDILSRSGALVEKSAVEKVIAEIHVPIVNGVRSMWRRVKAKMLTASESQQDRVWQEECDRLFSRLGATGFTQYE